MTGIPAGTPIIAGMTDGCAAQIGAGALEVGSWNSVLGTTLVLKGVTSRTDSRSRRSRVLASLSRRQLAAWRSLQHRCGGPRKAIPGT